VLRKAGIDTLIVCGIVTNGGVASTVRDAHVRDFYLCLAATDVRRSRARRTNAPSAISATVAKT
jgi:ureidoacrylate peracid hydrolase